MLKPNLFITGVPRSGTTLLSEIVNCHEDAAIMIDRFNNLFSKKELNQNFYELENALNFEKYPNVHQDVNLEILTKAKNSNVKYLGEKIPKFYEDPSFLNKISENGIIFATLRNPFDILLSYAARRNPEKEKNPAQFGLERGFKDFNKYLKNLEFIRKKI